MSKELTFEVSQKVEVEYGRNSELQLVFDRLEFPMGTEHKIHVYAENRKVASVRYDGSNKIVFNDRFPDFSEVKLPSSAMSELLEKLDRYKER